MPTTGWETIIRGDGPRTLVLIPGAMGTASIFNPSLDKLATNLRVIVASTPAEPDVNVIADQLARLLDSHNAPKVDLLGTSFGGYAAQFFAARFPERIGTLILSNTMADPSFSPRRRPLEELQAEPADEMLGKAVAMIGKTPESPTRDTLLYQLGIEAPEVFKARQVGLAMGGTAPMVDLTKINLVLVDTADDPVVAPPARDHLVERYSGSKRVTLERGGHFPYVVNVDAFVATVREAIGVPA
jgi:pimeloyl-ACP methyl ester carboxylesterase